MDRLISLWLAQAQAQQATAIVIGMPRELPSPLDADAVREELCRDDRPIHPVDTTAAHQALAMSSRLNSAANWTTVPVWMRIDGALYALPSPPVSFHFALLSRIQDRLVSLDASEQHPKPMRFIEFDSDSPPARLFAEVELWLDEDNTTRVEIMNYLRMPESVRAVASVE